MKGHTKIELFDGLTGKLTERVEDDNMFTNAIDQMVNFALSHNYFQYRAQGLSNGLKRMLEGHLQLVNNLLLFDSALSDDPDEIWAPASAKLTACGVNGVVNGNASVPMLGSYNSAESSGSGLTRTWVWDFATNQANGTIATACLTSRLGAYMGYGAPDWMGTAVPSGMESNYRSLNIGLGNIISSSRQGTFRGVSDNNYNFIQTNNAPVSFCVDSDADKLWQAKINSDGLVISTIGMSPVKFDLFRSIESVQPFEVYDERPASFTSAYYCFFYNTDEKALYFWGTDSGTNINPSSGTWVINRYDLEEKTLVTAYDTVTFSGKYVDILSTAVTRNAFYTKGYNADYNYLYKHTRGGGSGFSNIQIGSGFTYQDWANQPFILNGTLYMPSAGVNNASLRMILVDLSDDSIRYSPSQIKKTAANYGQNIRIVPPYSNKQMVFFTGQYLGYCFDDNSSYDMELEHSSYFGRTNTFTLGHYLATKNVLPTPVVKTSDRTMKVTYTITGEELT
mgnify:CR=1 FL=1